MWNITMFFFVWNIQMVNMEYIVMIKGPGDPGDPDRSRVAWRPSKKSSDFGFVNRLALLPNESFHLGQPWWVQRGLFFIDI